MSPITTTTLETTSSILTTTPLTNNSSSSSSTLGKKRNLGKRLWVVGRGNNKQKTRLFLLEGNGCQKKYSTEDTAIQRLWRPNSIAIGDDNINSIKYERGKRRRKLLVRIGTLAFLATVGSALLLFLWLFFIFWQNEESPQNTNLSSNLLSTTTSINSHNLNSKSTINSFLPSSTQTNFISISPTKKLKISTEIINNSSTLQTPLRPQKLKFSIILNTNLNNNNKLLLNNSHQKIIQIYPNFKNNLTKNQINLTKTFVEFDRLEKQQFNNSNEKINFGIIPINSTFLPINKLIKTNEILNNLTEKTKLLNTSSSTKEIENKTKENIRKEEEEEDLLWLRNQKIPKKYEKILSKFSNDNYNIKRPTIEFEPVKAVTEKINKDLINEKEFKINLKNIILTITTPNPTTKIINKYKTTTTSINNYLNLQEELNEIITSVERIDDKNNQKHSFEDDNINKKYSSSFEEEEEIKPVEIPFDPLPPPISEIPIWRRPPPGEENNYLNPPPPPLPPPISNVFLQANVKSTSNILPEINNKENQILKRKRREAPILVTALIDIGRGNWQRFTRHFDQYLNYLKNILFRIQNNIIIYCDYSVYEYLKTLNNNQLKWERIQIVIISLSELPFYLYKKEIEEIMNWEHLNWNKEWDEQMKTHPETLYPDYDILVNSKPYFLYNSTQITQFIKPLNGKEQIFAWIDAGYGHGSKSVIPLGLWLPNKINNKQITLIKLPTNGERIERYTIDKVYRKHRSIVSGGFLVGGENVIRRFWVFFMNTFLDLLDKRFVDDDQTTLLITIQRYNSTFNLLKGNWFDAFKLLPSSSLNK